MGTKHEVLNETAETAITCLFNDKSVGTAETANTLYDLIVFIQEMIDTL